MITERCRVNICSYTREIFTGKQRVYLSALNQRMCITDNYLRLQSAYFRWGTIELAKTHFPSIRTEIYFVCQVNGEGSDLILRIDIHRRITEKSHVKAIANRVHSRVALCGNEHDNLNDVFLYKAIEERVGNIKCPSWISYYS